jgi:uncharacterized protein (TIGR03437 family)
MVILWGTGFGSTDPPIPAGERVDRPAKIANDPTVRIGGLAAEYLGGALTPGSAGLYQLAIRLPDAAPGGDLPVVAEIAGHRTPDGVFITVVN